jgi:hypothetical protein
MEDLFLSYPTSFELKELGFNEPCFGKFTSSVYIPGISEDKTYKLELEINLNSTFDDNKNENFPTDWCSAPTYDQSFDWLLKIINKDVLFDSNKYSIRFDDVYYSLLLGGVVMFVFVTKEKVVIELIKVLKGDYE